MLLRERLFYLCFIILLGAGYIFYFFPDNEEYVDIYNSRIETLQCKIDSLNNVNVQLTYKVDTLNLQILGLDNELQQKNIQINDLRNEINSQVSTVDDFSNDELQEFFTIHYNHPRDTIR